MGVDKVGVRLVDQFGRGWFVFGLPDALPGMTITGIEWDREGEFNLVFDGDDKVAEKYLEGVLGAQVQVWSDNPDEPRH